MRKLSTRVLCQAYVLALLLAAAILSPLPYSPAAVVILLALVLLALRRHHFRASIGFTLAAFFLLALALEPLLEYGRDGGVVSVAAVDLGVFVLAPACLIVPVALLPLLYLLDVALAEAAPGAERAREESPGRHITAVGRMLYMAALVMLLVSVVAGSAALFLTVLAFVLYLLSVLLLTVWKVPETVVEAPVLGRRVIAGSTTEVDLPVRSRALTRLYAALGSVEPWVKVSPGRFSLNGAGTHVALQVTPPLAGPSEPEMWVSAVDRRGLMRVRQELAPLALQVIPRARYAQWLATRYLEQTAGAGTGVAGTPETGVALKRGTEYLDSRSYEPGDELKYVDWKHTVKLGQWTVKEFVEVGGQAAIVGVNLCVSDVEEADILAFDLITMALTLAQESVPTSLAAYDHSEVVVSTAAIEPREVVKHALGLLKDIAVVEPRHRSRQPADIARLRRDIVLLEKATSSPAGRLLDMLRFEQRAIEHAARDHPATLALLRSAQRTPAPAAIMLISRLNHDAEALMVVTEKLSRRGFSTLPLPAARQDRGARPAS